MGYLDDKGLLHVWGKVKAKLSAKQDTLTGIPGQVVGFDASGAAEAVQGWSNPNLLDNWYFGDPINQRGLTEYVGDGYSIDRWRIQAAHTLIVQSGNVLLKTGSAGDRIMQQNLEDPDKWLGTTLTFSVLYNDSSLCTTTVTLPSVRPESNTSYGQQAATNFSIAIRVANNNDGYVAPVISTNLNSEFALIAAKLELGAQQTLAHQDAGGNWVLNDPPPNKALEMNKCQRYQIRLPEDAQYAGRTLNEDGASIVFMIPLAATMRTGHPTLIGTYAITAYHNGESKPVTLTNLKISNYSPNVQCSGTIPAGWVPKTPLTINWTANSAGNILDLNL